LQNGEDILKDLKRSAHYFKLAAAQFNYGVCLQKGEGVDRNIAAAFRYLKLLDENGSPDIERQRMTLKGFLPLILILQCRIVNNVLTPLALSGDFVDLTVAAEFFKKVDGANSFGCYLKQRQEVNVNIDLEGLDRDLPPSCGQTASGFSERTSINSEVLSMDSVNIVLFFKLFWCASTSSS
jgi:hypothetical protein